MICQHQCSHGLYDRHSAGYDTWIVTAFAFQCDVITYIIYRCLILDDGSDRLECYIEINIHSIGDVQDTLGSCWQRWRLPPGGSA